MPPKWKEKSYSQGFESLIIWERH